MKNLEFIQFVRLLLQISSAYFQSTLLKVEIISLPIPFPLKMNSKSKETNVSEVALFFYVAKQYLFAYYSLDN